MRGRLPHLLVVALWLFPVTAAAQAWTPPAGEGKVGVTVEFVSATSWYDHEDVVQDLVTSQPSDGTPYSGRSVIIAGEYGMIEDLSVVGRLEVFSVRVKDGSVEPAVERSSTDIRSAYAGLRLGLADRLGLGAASALSINLGAHIPLGYRRNIIPSVGTGQVDIDLVASYGHTFVPLAITAQAGVGYRFRSRMFGLSRTVSCSAQSPDDEGPICIPEFPQGDYSDEVIGHFGATYAPIERLSLQVSGEVTWSIERPEMANMPGGIVQTAGFIQQRYARVGGGVDVRLFGETWLTTLIKATPYGQNTLDSSHVLIGIASRF